MTVALMDAEAIRVALLLAALSCVVPGAAQAQTRCGPRAAVVKSLVEKYAETRRSIGISANNLVMEIYAAENTGTWTITVTSPQGRTCLVASGYGFEATNDPAPPSGSPL